jgi:hypothetical protein
MIKVGRERMAQLEARLEVIMARAGFQNVAAPLRTGVTVSSASGAVMGHWGHSVYESAWGYIGSNSFADPTGMGLRGCDNAGCGGFGASRNDGLDRHRGGDRKSTPGQEIVAPMSGTIKRYSYPYGKAEGMEGVEITANGVSTIIWYVSVPESMIGQTISAGQSLGVAQDVAAYHAAHGTFGMTNHVHVQIQLPGGVFTNPTNFIPPPPTGPGG